MEALNSREAPRALADGKTSAQSAVETDKGDVPIWKEYFQLWYMQGTPYALYDNYVYVTL